MLPGSISAPLGPPLPPRGPSSALCFCLRQRRLSAILFTRCRDCHCCTEVRLIAEIGLHICLIAFRLEFVIHLQNFVVCCVAVLCVFCVSGRLCSTSPPGGNQVDGLPPAPLKNWFKIKLILYFYITLYTGASGKPSTWFPLGGLVELRSYSKRINLCLY